MPVDSLPIGAKLDASIHDEHGVLLLERGLELTAAFVQGLRARGLVHVQIGKGEKAPPRLPVSRRGGDAAFSVERILEDIAKHLQRIVHHPNTTSSDYGKFDPVSVLLVRKHIQRAAAEIEQVICDAESGRVINIDGVQEVTAQTVIDVADDTDLAVHSALQFSPSDREYAARLRTAALQSSVLSLAIGLRLGMDATQLLHLGTAAMLSDIGLVQHPVVSRGVAIAVPPSREQLWLSHPERAFEHLTAIKTVPGPVLQAIRQHHELMDGTGFPLRLPDDRISLSARIIGVTQAFLAMTSPLDGSEGFMPSDSMAYLIHHALQGRLCLRVMRAFVHATSIYPQGSVVQLADNRLGTVLRCVQGDLLRPVIQLDGEICDLRYTSNGIVRPASMPAIHQRRLPTRLLNEVLW